MKKITLLMLAALTISACTTQRFPMTTTPLRFEPAYEKTHHSVGLKDYQMVDPISICGSPGNIAMIETKISNSQAFLRFLTINIYRPYDVRIYCKNTPTNITLSGPYAKQQNTAAAQNIRQPQPAYQVPQSYQPIQGYQQPQGYQGGYAQQGYYQPQQRYTR